MVERKRTNMNADSISFWADVAAIFIVAQLFVFTFVTAIGLGMGWWYLRKGRKKLATPLLLAQVYALRAQQGTLKVSDKVAAVPISIHAFVTQVQVTAQTLWRANHLQKG
jgi:hypothetical protein